MSIPVPETNSTQAGESALDLGALIHSSAGIIALVLGGLMYAYSWALPLFSGLMILSAVSAIWISWSQDAWVPGHWLAMLPIIGIGLGYFVAPWGYTLAYICLWIAFAHFIIRGIQKVRAQRQTGA
ncbi:MAG: hypothetical protein H6985_04680 [Pseudomonadales bacterium]|nr:hypothetical protein [Halioglobus sp.]MCP5128865.1 hypothetical protein [Pseudomonadales bacterium]